ncbi:hypothetical protein ACFWPA_00810 [Rhodococcus sp. NPDC058505]|uniref:hypothetical protein n=1 Tax=unclassified Rhodococcus (in: high G+C Gram-positive bacteria) TaxID=192944 RepID=UPI0036506DE6
MRNRFVWMDLESSDVAVSATRPIQSTRCSGAGGRGHVVGGVTHLRSAGPRAC